MNDRLATRHAAALAAHLGAPGRMVGLSKSAYRDAHPQHLVVFNANVCFSGGKVWWGDIDLTVDEHSLEGLAAQTRETVYVLFELDGRFRHEAAPVLERAVYSVTPDGHTRFDAPYFERAADGRLYARAPLRPPGFRRPARPRLWRFWRVELRRECTSGASGRWNSVLLYIGSRGRRRGGPLLVWGFHWWANVARGAWVEWTWYPSGRRSWAPALGGRLKWHRGPVRPFVAVRVVPGVCTEARVGGIFGPTDPLRG